MTDSVLTPSASQLAGVSGVYEAPAAPKRKTPDYGGISAAKTVRGLSRSRSRLYAGISVRRFGAAVSSPFSLVFAAAARGLTKAGASEITLVSAVASFLYAFFSGIYTSSVAANRFAARAYHLTVLRFTRRSVSRLNGMLLILAAVFIMISTSFISISLEVFLDGKSIGYVRNQAEFETALSNVEARASELLKHPYKIFPDVSYEFNIIDRRNLLDTKALESHLFNQISELEYTYVLSVDGEQIGISKSKAELEGILSELLEPYRTGDPTERVNFLRDVEIGYQLAAANTLSDVAKIKNILGSHITEKKYYAAVPGDLYETIAAKHGMSRDELLSLNPGIDSSRLAVGQEIVVDSAISFLPVVQTRTIVYDEAIPFETEKIENANMYKGDSQTVTAGVNGISQVTAEVRHVDGEFLDQTVVGTRTVQEPVTRVMIVGTKTPPPTHPTGTYIRPASGVLTSNYGSRKLGGKYEFHTGVDFANSYGTPVKAIDGGTVSYAGWKSGYGYCVIIDHRNGIQSLYGHNSSLLVKVGQKVAQGTTIAKMGSTGRSTGNHCHLEIRVNGKHVNPWNYIK